MNHKEKCECETCNDVAAGMTYEEAMIKRKEWENNCLKEVGWFAHYVGDDKNYPTEFNAHTHGLVEKYNHRDLQIVVPLPPAVCHGIFWNIIKRIEKGEKFKSGDVISDIAENDYKTKFVNAWENDRPVLRVIIPDKDHNLDRGKFTSEFFDLQYADLDPDYE